MQFFNTPERARETDEEGRNRQFLMNTALIAGGLVFIFGVIYLSGTGIRPGIVLAIPVLLIVCGSVWYFARVGKSILGSRIFLATFLFFTSLALLTAAPIILLASVFLICAVFALLFEGSLVAWAILGFSGLLLLATSATGNLYFSLSTTGQSAGRVEIPSAILIILILAFVLWIASYISGSLKRSAAKVGEQATALQKSLGEIEQKRALGEDVSRQVFSLITELNAIAAQQSSGSRVQAVGITQMTSFLGELAATAQSIASQTRSLSKLAQNIKQSTLKVRETSKSVGEAGENGAVAVENTLNGSQRLNEVYRELKEDLAGLERQQVQIKEVADTIKEISEETRLLALNALIEAAGAGEYGERFGVVAGEVKTLADKAGHASQEIGLILNGVEERIQKVLKVSERGQSQMQEVLQLAEVSGDVIRELVFNLYEGNIEMEEVERDVISMGNYTLEIQTATDQQSNAAQLALETLQSIGTIASQNASSSGEVTNSTQDLERLSHHLLSVLVA